jgi:hypothetical protein
MQRCLRLLVPFVYMVASHAQAPATDLKMLVGRKAV